MSLETCTDETNDDAKSERGTKRAGIYFTGSKQNAMSCLTNVKNDHVVEAREKTCMRDGGCYALHRQETELAADTREIYNDKKGRDIPLDQEK